MSTKIEELETDLAAVHAPRRLHAVRAIFDTLVSQTTLLASQHGRQAIAMCLSHHEKAGFLHVHLQFLASQSASTFLPHDLQDVSDEAAERLLELARSGSMDTLDAIDMLTSAAASAPAHAFAPIADAVTALAADCHAPSAPTQWRSHPLSALVLRQLATQHAALQSCSRMLARALRGSREQNLAAAVASLDPFLRFSLVESQLLDRSELQQLAPAAESIVLRLAMTASGADVRVRALVLLLDCLEVNTHMISPQQHTSVSVTSDCPDPGPILHSFPFSKSARYHLPRGVPGQPSRCQRIWRMPWRHSSGRARTWMRHRGTFCTGLTLSCCSAPPRPWRPVHPPVHSSRRCSA